MPQSSSQARTRPGKLGQIFCFSIYSSLFENRYTQLSNVQTTPYTPPKNKQEQKKWNCTLHMHCVQELVFNLSPKEQSCKRNFYSIISTIQPIYSFLQKKKNVQEKKQRIHFLFFHVWLTVRHKWCVGYEKEADYSLPVKCTVRRTSAVWLKWCVGTWTSGNCSTKGKCKVKL